MCLIRRPSNPSTTPSYEKHVRLLLLLFLRVATGQLGRGPVFLHEPPPHLDFANSTGALLPCSAHGTPPPVISWLTSSGGQVEDLAGVRKTYSNGSLHLLPFPPSSYSAWVHATTYSCKVSSSEGIILSRPTKVRAVVSQYYEVQVYDEFVISGNTAVIKCHVPSFVRDYVTVIGWIRSSGEKILSDVEEGGRYSVFASGELHIRHVTKTDEFQSYQCVTRHILTGESSTSAVAGRLMVNDPRSSVPPRITDSKPLIRASVGMTVELPCAAQGYPIPQYRWFKIKGSKTQDLKTREIHQNERLKQVGGSLLIRQVEAADAGKYSCVVSSSVGEEKTQTTVEVWAPLGVHITPQIQTVDVGGGASFNCSVEGFPVDNITWLKDGERLHFDSHVTTVSLKRVVVDRVTRNDRGMYQCLVSNEHDSAQGSAQLKLGDAFPQWVNKSGVKVVSPGAKVTLDCIVQGSPPPTLQWTLRGELITLDSMRAVIDKEVVRDTVYGRLYIPSVAVEDGGIWSCSAENRAGQIIHRERLNVRGPPSIRPLAPINVVAGRSMNFDCVVAGYPIDSIYWEKSEIKTIENTDGDCACNLGVVLPVSQRQKIYPNGTLEIQQISREADGGEYTCVATAGDKTVRSKLRITVLVPPEIDRRLFSWGSGYPLGSPARIMCVAVRGDMPIRFLWYHSSKPLQPRNAVSIRYLDDQTSILLFTSLKESDAGNYTCVAANEISKDSHSSYLLVKVAPSWKEEPIDTSVVVGSNVKLACNALGSPKPNITWRMARGEVPRQYVPIELLGNNLRVTEENRTLNMKAIRRDQGGELLCLASNGVGSDLSKTIKITVKVPPQFEIKEENVTVIAGRRAKLMCLAFGNLPINIIWFKGNPAFQLPNSELNDQYELTNTVVNETYAKYWEKSDGDLMATDVLKKEKIYGEALMSTIMVATSSRHDSERFLCLATNMYGNDTKITKLIVQEVPGQPGSPRVTNVGSRSINLTWDPPSHNGNSVINEYRILIINSTDSWVNMRGIRRLEASGTTVTVGGLQPAHSYLVRVIATNGIGTSTPSEEVRIITVHEPPSSSPTNIRVVPMSSSSLKVSWMLPDTPVNQIATFGYYIGLKLANTTEPFRYETIDSQKVNLHHPEAVLSSLRKFSSYVITVQAFNEAGAGPKSAPVIAKTDEDVPSEPPGDIQCSSLSSTSLLLKWRPPDMAAINGVLVGYKIVYASEEAQTRAVLTQSTTLQGLSPYTNYTIHIAAYTKVGDGVRSEYIHCITNEDVPGPISNIKGLSVDQNNILLSWLPPDKPNGVITKYSLTMRQHQFPSSTWQSDERARLPASRSVLDSSLLESFRNPPNNMIQMTPRMAEDSDTTERSWIVQGSEDQYMVGGLSERRTYSFSVRAATKVGMGPPGASVIQKPRHDAPATIASFSRVLIAVWGEELRLICRVVGTPTPTRTWSFNGKKIEESLSRVSEYPDGSLLLSEIRSSDAGNYTCTVSNIHGSDSVIYAVNVEASKEKGAPPSTPVVYVSDVTGESIELRWRPSQHGENVETSGYYVHMKQEYGDWKRIEVSGVPETYTLTGLDCGTRYQVYVSAYNHIGTSQPSDAIATRTLGREPIVPPRSEFLRENSTSVALKLSAWPDGGCRISSFVIEYQRYGSNTWRMVSNYAGWDDGSDFVIKNLSPDGSYLLRVTAHNAAGSSVATYPFSTANRKGTFESEELQGSQWGTEASVVVSVIVLIILVVAVGTGVILFSRRRMHAIETQQCKEINHTVVPLCPASNGTILRRQSMDSMHIIDAYSPPNGHQKSLSDDTVTYYTFKMESPHNPPQSPETSDHESLKYNHRGYQRPTLQDDIT